MKPDRIQGFHYKPRFVIRDVWRPWGEQEIWSCEDLPENEAAFQAQCRLEKFRLGYLAVRKALEPVTKATDTMREGEDR